MCVCLGWNKLEIPPPPFPTYACITSWVSTHYTQIVGGDCVSPSKFYSLRASIRRGEEATTLDHENPLRCCCCSINVQYVMVLYGTAILPNSPKCTKNVFLQLQPQNIWFVLLKNLYFSKIYSSMKHQFNMYSVGMKYPFITITWQQLMPL